MSENFTAYLEDGDKSVNYAGFDDKDERISQTKEDTTTPPTKVGS
jgi:hypothetical protein